MNYVIYLSLFFGVVISGLSVFLFRITNKQLKLLLSFTGAFLFAICVLDLIPEIYKTGDASIGIYVLIGFFIQLLLEFFSQGVEHGHMHVHKEEEGNAHIVPYGMMIGLCIHSFFEGMPLSAYFTNHSVHLGNPLLYGIIFHHIPVAIALMSILLQSGLKKQAVILLLIVFALMAPMGAFISNHISGVLVGNMSVYYNRVMGIVIGIFLHISTTILFETSEEHRFHLYKFISVVLGAAVAILMFL